jgi:hypothetical protein
MRKPAKKVRINWKKEIRKVRNSTIQEAIDKIAIESGRVPTEWQRGYYSAITQLETMKDEY